MPEIPPSEVRADAFRSGRVGVSDAELIGALEESISELIGPVCIVSRRKVPALNEWVTERLAADVGGAPTKPTVTADELKDVPQWVRQQNQPVTVLVYLTLWNRASNNAALVALREIAADGSRMVFVEPTLGVGVASLLQRIAKPMLRRRIGLSFHRDIPAIIRAAGWQLTTVNRVSVGAPASVMTFVVGEARIYG